MPDKDYEIVLRDDARIIVTVRMVGGRVVSFVVRLVARKGDVEVDVARYDTAHGKPHLDLLRVWHFKVKAVAGCRQFRAGTDVGDRRFQIKP
jgi:hypothetical protein